MLEKPNLEKRVIMVINELINLKELDRYILSQVVEKIEIFEEEIAEVNYRFKLPW